MQLLQRKHFHAFWTALTRFLTVRDETQEIRFLFDFASCFKCFTIAPPNPHLAEFHRIAGVLYPQIENSDGQFVAVCQFREGRPEFAEEPHALPRARVPQSLASTGEEFKHCSACRVVAYCGKACQTRAWKAGTHAHKRICAQIKTLVAKGGGLDDWDAFVRNCREAKVSADEALEVAKWEFNPAVGPLNLGRSANADGAAEFWQLNPDKHPAAAERFARFGHYWGPRPRPRTT
ncbi:hypothetical protein C8R44DRAFT_731025 [Mycena epipterygia]|nr:hypothetical protein C8R44DRAFT_731025 [Mycena epipterygia]